MIGRRKILPFWLGGRGGVGVKTTESKNTVDPLVNNFCKNKFLKSVEAEKLGIIFGQQYLSYITVRVETNISKTMLFFFVMKVLRKSLQSNCYEKVPAQGLK